MLAALIVLLLLIGGVSLMGMTWYAAHASAGDVKLLREHEANAEAETAELFTGETTVIYNAPDNSGGLKLDTLVAAANKHGYRLVSEDGVLKRRRVIFERAS